MIRMDPHRRLGNKKICVPDGLRQAMGSAGKAPAPTTRGRYNRDGRRGLQFGVGVRAYFTVQVDFFVLRGSPFHGSGSWSKSVDRESVPQRSREKHLNLGTWCVLARLGRTYSTRLPSGSSVRLRKSCSEECTKYRAPTDHVAIRAGRSLGERSSPLGIASESSANRKEWRRKYKSFLSGNRTTF